MSTVYIQVPSYPTKYDATPLANAIVSLGMMSIDLVAFGGAVEVTVFPNVASVNKEKSDSFWVEFGEDLGGGHTFPTLTQIMNTAAGLVQSQGLTPGEAIRRAAGGGLLNHPKLSGAVVITV